MKQNSSILFHSMDKILRNRYRAAFAVVVAMAMYVAAGVRAADTPEYLESFNPAAGFKPAQRDLTEIFLQIAGSLEANGTPEPYLRHMLAEHERIESLYRKKFGKEPASHRPAYMTNAYVEKLIANWNLLSPKIGLAPYAKDMGHLMHDAIKGTRGTGTVIIDILNQHQARVFDQMAGKNVQDADFESLRKELVTKLELDNPNVSEGRYEVARRDAISYAVIMHGVTTKLFQKVDSGLASTAAERVKAVLLSEIIDTGMMAQSELEAGIAEWALSRTSTAGR